MDREPADDVLLVCKDELVESNTYHAQGGVACAIFSDDDPQLHTADTMAAGHGLCDRTAVDVLTDEGARRVRELIAAGWHVDRGDDGSVLRGLEPRTAVPAWCTPGETPPVRCSKWMSAPWCAQPAHPRARTCVSQRSDRA